MDCCFLSLIIPQLLEYATKLILLIQEMQHATISLEFLEK